MTTGKTPANSFFCRHQPAFARLRIGLLGTVLLASVAIFGAQEVKAGPGKIDVREEITCLAQNIYFEARGEPDTGKLAVGYVVMNRVTSDEYPDRVCAVVRQGGQSRLHQCQFSWWCDGRSDEPSDTKAWQRAQTLARAVYWNVAPDPTNGAQWYHADYVAPTWGSRFERGPVIGRHVFYRVKSDDQPHKSRGPQLAERPTNAQ